MLPEDRVTARLVSSRIGTLGDLATAAFVIAAASGAALAVPYDPADSYGSVAALLLANPAGVFFRNVHYWAGQLCLLLTLWHVVDHLRVGTEERVRPGVWLRLALTVPAVAFVMLSGFILRGDAEGRQALRIITEATSQLPLAGPFLATLVFGVGERLDLVYIQHAATATIVIWLFIIEHARRVWPRTASMLSVAVITGAVSLVATPGLHDGLQPVVKGPWYFLGLQELLHWTPWPRLVLLLGAVVVGGLFAVRLFPRGAAARTKGALLALLVAYAGLCVVGGYFRGENWSWSPGWPGGPSVLRVGWIFPATPDAPTTLPAPLPVVMERPEGCLVCHQGVTGLGDAHRPEAIGCASCHGGDVFSLQKDRAHAAMERSPGHLVTASTRCGQAACHPSIVPRVERSLMATMSGIVLVNREVFGESHGTRPHVGNLGRSPSETHLRQLCASCHLGREKLDFGPNDEASRGGGCNACHLVYSTDALKSLGRYQAEKAAGAARAPRVHPALSLDIGNGQCFGCHSRSGRISTSYEGWHELHDAPESTKASSHATAGRFRVLQDERVFERVTPDIHHERGMDCIDCHTSKEVMGDGVAHTRKTDQLRVTCEDCHVAPGATVATVSGARLDPESRKILSLRPWSQAVGREPVATRSGDSLVNVVPGNPPVMIRKRTGERRVMKRALPVCVEGGGHKRLSCGSCHTAWAPRCPTCHTSFDAKAEAYDWVDDAHVTGAWREEGGPFRAALPTLGVRRASGPGGTERQVIETFVPGMVLTIDAGPASGGARFRRLYARVEPHTTRREARSCESCHNDPEALGYGRGELRYDVGSAGGRWRFTPAAPILPVDGLPGDAWIPFLGSREGSVSTRGDVRPFSPEEQKRILRVGACLTCHRGDSSVMREAVRNFDEVLARRDRRCILPAW